jgi:hypothetical protein
VPAVAGKAVTAVMTWRKRKTTHLKDCVDGSRIVDDDHDYHDDAEDAHMAKCHCPKSTG